MGNYIEAFNYGRGAYANPHQKGKTLREAGLANNVTMGAVFNDKMLVNP
jgi:hypothetical protein